jgi:hypothetical protein
MNLLIRFLSKIEEATKRVAYSDLGQGAVVMTNSDNGFELVQEIVRALLRSTIGPTILLIPSKEKVFHLHWLKAARFSPQVFPKYSSTAE